MSNETKQEKFKQPINHRVTLGKLDDAYQNYNMYYEIDGDSKTLLVSPDQDQWPD